MPSPENGNPPLAMSKRTKTPIAIAPTAPSAAIAVLERSSATRAFALPAPRPRSILCRERLSIFLEFPFLRAKECSLEPAGSMKDKLIDPPPFAYADSANAHPGLANSRRIIPLLV